MAVPTPTRHFGCPSSWHERTTPTTPWLLSGWSLWKRQQSHRHLKLSEVTKHLFGQSFQTSLLRGDPFLIHRTSRRSSESSLIDDNNSSRVRACLSGDPSYRSTSAGVSVSEAPVGVRLQPGRVHFLQPTADRVTRDAIVSDPDIDTIFAPIPCLNSRFVRTDNDSL